jgi:hypothetical protein
MTLTEKYAERHPSTVQLLRWLEPNPNLPKAGLAVSRQFEVVAGLVVDQCTDGPELSAGLRKLLEAKDCLVRAALS